MRSRSLMTALLLLSVLGDEQLRAAADAQKKDSRWCSCLPEVRDRQPAVDGKCWNCGKLVVEP